MTTITPINSILGRFQIKPERALVLDNAGFTLVELLVVVLIVGILTAIALPMYNHAVVKSRFSSMIPSAKEIANAQELYYMEHGSYAREETALDVQVANNPQTLVTLSDMSNYKYVMTEHEQVPGAAYIVYQKHSKRFADNIHCEAEENDTLANWLCEKGLGGTRIAGSVSGSGYLTYLLSGNAGNDKFIREDCPAGYYDKDGRCVIAGVGRYAEDGEQKQCEPGTYQDKQGQTSCNKCPAGKYQPYSDGYGFCYNCRVGAYNNSEGNSSCQACPAGTYQDKQGQTSCKPCPAGKYQPYDGGYGYCYACKANTYNDSTGNTSCKACPAGTTANADHTACE